jgi:5-oxopent-3-ene-1,2,5-tricarboxylate decarboxylase / 2-hydroxyhepta-2,4-diene-1,7-dioate isomerase
MFAVANYLVHLEGEALPRDVNAQTAASLCARATACRPPVSGAVYGTLLNDPSALVALGDAMNMPPYKAPPKAPILYLKPRNTLAGNRARVVVPDDAHGVEVGASLGIVIGRTATRVRVESAFDFIAGFTVVADISVPHASLYRPSVRLRARDGFCVVGPTVVAARHVPTPDNLKITANVVGKTPFVGNTASTVRNVAQLVSDVTDFMTLSAGDVLTLGVPYGSPIVHVGDKIEISIANWAPLSVSFIGTEEHDGEDQ